jgi:hypothetical protein
VQAEVSKKRPRLGAANFLWQGGQLLNR